MHTSDVTQLSVTERQLLAGSFHPKRLQRRIRGIVLSALAVLIGIALLLEFGLSATWFAAISGTVLVISLVEKMSYHRTMLSYESLIRRCVHRIEQLEGLGLTPEDGGDPGRPRLRYHSDATPVSEPAERSLTLD